VDARRSPPPPIVSFPLSAGTARVVSIVPIPHSHCSPHPVPSQALLRATTWLSEGREGSDTVVSAVSRCLRLLSRSKDFVAGAFQHADPLTAVVSVLTEAGKHVGASAAAAAPAPTVGVLFDAASALTSTVEDGGTRATTNSREAWVRGAVPMTTGHHRWHLELVFDKEGDEGSAMGVCVETPAAKYNSTGWWTYRAWNGACYQDGTTLGNNAK
jgi:hypothetical protein